MGVCIGLGGAQIKTEHDVRRLEGVRGLELFAIGLDRSHKLARRKM